MKPWLQLTEDEPSDEKPVLYVNSNNILYFTGDKSGSRLFLVGMPDEESLSVVETPEQILVKLHFDPGTRRPRGS